MALQYIAHRYGITAHYALELIEGMAMDVRGTRYGTLKELLLYCYRVAGTVGLMMSHVMGLRDEKALKYAADRESPCSSPTLPETSPRMPPWVGFIFR